MSGNRYLASPGEMVKHAHLKFYREDGYSLMMVDVRRFAKWDWTESWSSKRGPCPLSEYEAFVKISRLQSIKRYLKSRSMK